MCLNYLYTFRGALHLANYQEERTNIGPQGGEEARDAILQLLSEHGEMKASHIVEEGNKSLENRELKNKSWYSQIQNLVISGRIEKVREGVYRLSRT